MRKFISLIFALALTLTFSIPVSAGEVPIGVWCYSQECTEQNPAPMNFFWHQETEDSWQMYCSNCG